MLQMRTLVPALVPLTLTVAPVGMSAQTCFQGGTVERCRTFWITEFEFGRRLDAPVVVRGTDDDWLENLFLAAEVGHMVNLENRWALGGTLMVAGAGGTSRLGAKLRVRRWIDPGFTTDAGMGLLLTGSDIDYQQHYPGFTAHLGLRYRDLIGVSLRLDVIGGEPKPGIAPNPIGSDAAWHIGVTTGSFAALVSSLAMALLAMAVAGDFSLDWSTIGGT